MTTEQTLDLLLQQMPDHLPGGVLIYRDNKREEILYANPWLLSMFGCSSFDDFLELTGGSFVTLVHPEDREQVERDIRQQIAGSRSKLDFVNYRVIRKDGSVRRVEEFGHRVFIPGVGAVFYVFFLDNDTKYKIYDTDSLTGLPGKTRFIRHASMVLALAAHDPKAPKMALVYVNIHNFNQYNLRNGSEKGNQFLVRMTEVLRENFPNKLISRFMDDHFVVLTTLPSLEKQISVISSQIHGLYDSSWLDVKFGIYPVEDDTIPVESACGMAQMACDSIKDIPDRHVCFYTKTMGEARDLRNYVIDHFREALEKHWIQVYFQPVVRTISGTLASVEALSRWRDPEKGMISPGIFIPILEDSRQIRKLDLYVLEEICRLYQQQLAEGKVVIPTSFNLSRMDFFQGSIFEDVEEIRKRYQVPRNMLYVEITESLFVHEGDVLHQEIQRFRQAGYEVWMDDFGSGYSSLNTLKNYSFDEIKIDMAFLSQFTEKSQNIIKAIIRMAKKIGIHTLMEGVETREQAEFARSIGCELIQGYYYGRPMSFEELKQMYREKRWQVETPELRQYYGKLGSIDFLTDRPMAVAEVAGNRFRYLFANEEYRNTIRAAGMESLRQTEVFVNALAGPISKNIHSFLHDVIHTSSEKTLTYTVNGRYMRLEASYLASHDKHHLLLLYLTNFTIQEDQNASDSLDWVNRNLLYLYQNVSLVDMENDTAVPLVMNSPYRKYFYQKRTGIQDIVQQYTRTMIHPEDQERFLAFNELDSMMGRIRKSPEGMISGGFRTLGNDGEYHWDIHSIFPAIRKGKVYLLYTARHFPKANA
ncbi:EAL domain-containing protein [Acidaminococcus fermentans]|uniref:EAL domain-containing protein n=1 Tax=Acidaminococcus fermentans TaxID=905 RepID=UPI00242B330F|nr:EAL domain-containing protein [Acidaminococcus fermentans]